MKTKVFIFIFFLILASLRGQDLLDQIKMPEEPMTAKRNTQLFFEGLGLNILGVAGMAGTVYWWIEFYDEEEYLLPTGTFSTSLGLAVIGMAMMVKSVSNTVQVRRSYHHYQKSKKVQGISFSIEPTRYGIGIVCSF